jgi:hypothetical protein
MVTVNNNAVSEDLRQFFGGYFHEDWDLEATDWQAAVDGYCEGDDPIGLLALAQEIDALRQAFDENELEDVMYRQAWCCYHPRPLSYNDWMGQVADRLRENAAAIERGGTPQ